MGVITQYYRSIGKYAGLVSHFGSKEDVQETFLTVGLVQNSDKVRYSELYIYMHNRYLNRKYHWTKTLLSTLKVLVNFKEGKRPPAQQYEPLTLLQRSEER